MAVLWSSLADGLRLLVALRVEFGGSCPNLRELEEKALSGWRCRTRTWGPSISLRMTAVEDSLLNAQHSGLLIRLLVVKSR
jgi:hypothetical protein